MGTLYGIGVGPGDPELLTLKAVRVLGGADAVYLPSSRFSKESFLQEVVDLHANSDSERCTVTFSLAGTAEERRDHWRGTAGEIVARLRSGQEVAFLTLGDPLLYSTYIYLVRALREDFTNVPIVTIPGVNSFSLAAALTDTPLGEGEAPLHVLPSSSEPARIAAAVESGASVVLMKVGPRLQEMIALLERTGALGRSVFVSRAGLPGERIEKDLTRLLGAGEEVGNLSVIVVRSKR